MLATLAPRLARAPRAALLPLAAAEASVSRPLRRRGDATGARRRHCSAIATTTALRPRSAQQQQQQATRRFATAAAAAAAGAPRLSTDATAHSVFRGNDAAVLSPAQVEEAAAHVRQHGFVVLPSLLPKAQIDALATRLRGRVDTVMDALRSTAADIGIGSAAGFHEVVQRSPGRFDVPTAFSDFSADDLAPFESVVHAVLGSDAAPAFAGTVFSRPGSTAQEWHSDSLHLFEEHAPAHLVNVLLALSDISLEMGPTEFSPGSQRYSNHRANARVNPDEVVYQFETNQPGAIGASEDTVTCALPKGTVLVFDDRVLHRGGGNSSDTDRYVAYFSYKRPWFDDNTHFEATRSLFATAGQPTSGAAPAPAQASASASASESVSAASLSAAATAPAPAPGALAEGVRPEFPSIADNADAVFCDGASGSQVHSSVIAAVAAQLREGSANVGGYYRTSVKALDVVARARDASADLLGCDSHEIQFGHNMTTLTFHLAQSLAHEIEPGDNVVLTRLEHDANAAPWIRMVEERGGSVRWVPVRGPDFELDMAVLSSAVDERTKLVACGYASNAVGTVNDVAAVCATARAVGAYSFVDAVHYAPHGLLDVADIGCDFLACSPYKFFGPHAGILFGRAEVMSRLQAYKLRTASNDLPTNANWQISRWELGTPNFEALAGVEACVEYLAGLGPRFGGADAGASRRDRLAAGWGAIEAHEIELKRQFLSAAASVPRLHVLGINDPARAGERTATFAVVKTDDSGAVRDPDAVTRALVEDHGVWCTSGNHYCTFWSDLSASGTLGGHLRLTDDDGATRIGLMHYNTAAEVDRALEALERV